MPDVGLEVRLQRNAVDRCLALQPRTQPAADAVVGAEGDRREAVVGVVERQMLPDQLRLRFERPALSQRYAG